MKCLPVLLTILAAMIIAEQVDAQIHRETPKQNVTRRQAEQMTRINPYWKGFILKAQGDCATASKHLRPIAKLGFGYEEAQVALGQCLLQIAGFSQTAAVQPDRAGLIKEAAFIEAIAWLQRAAEAGNFKAQGVLVSLYAVNLGPNTDLVEGAKWAHLYLTNPTRLNLGAPVLTQASINQLKDNMDTDNWLIGKERARAWTPRFARAQQKTSGKTREKTQ